MTDTQKKILNYVRSYEWTDLTVKIISANTGVSTASVYQDSAKLRKQYPGKFAPVKQGANGWRKSTNKKHKKIKVIPELLDLSRSNKKELQAIAVRLFDIAKDIFEISWEIK